MKRKLNNSTKNLRYIVLSNYFDTGNWGKKTVNMILDFPLVNWGDVKYHKWVVCY